MVFIEFGFVVVRTQVSISRSGYVNEIIQLEGGEEYRRRQGHSLLGALRRFDWNGPYHAVNGA